MLQYVRPEQLNIQDHPCLCADVLAAQLLVVASGAELGGHSSRPLGCTSQSYNLTLQQTRCEKADDTRHLQAACLPRCLTYKALDAVWLQPLQCTVCVVCGTATVAGNATLGITPAQQAGMCIPLSTADCQLILCACQHTQVSFKLFGILPGSIGLRGKVIPVAAGEPHGSGKAGDRDTVEVLFEPPVLSLADCLHLRIGGLKA